MSRKPSAGTNTIQASKKAAGQGAAKPIDGPASLDFRATFAVIEAAAGDGAPKVPRFDMVAYNGGPLRLANFSYPVVADLAGMKIPSQKIPARLEHDPMAGVGHTDKIANDGSQLTASGVVSRDTPAARDVVSSGLRGFPWQASIGASIESREFLAQGATASVNGQTVNGPCIIARQTTLRELTICDAGADETTSVTIAAKAAQLNKEIHTMDPKFSEWLQAKGFDPATISATQQTALEAAWKFETGQAKPDAKPDVKPDAAKPAETITAGDPVLEIRAKAAAEVVRMSEIETISATYATRLESKTLVTIKANAIKDGWDGNRYELELIRAERPKAPAAHINHGNINSEVIEAAVRLGTSERQDMVEKAYKPEVLERAYPMRRMGLMGLIQACCAMDGRPMPSPWATESEVIRAAFSSASLPGILGSAMNKTLLTAYGAVASVAKQVAAKLTANDFKTHTGYRLSGDAMLSEVGSDGELKHGTLGESSYPYSVKTFGRIYGITRQMLKNDDLGALMGLPAKLGRGAAQALEDAFWTLVLANTGTFFGAGNKNYISGATTVLSDAGLAQAVQKFRDQQDPDGYPILATPKYVVCPTSLEEVAWQLYKSTNLFAAGLASTSAASNAPAANIYAGLFEPKVTPYLNNTGYTGYSATAWYLFGDPADIAAFGVAYLDGNEQPTIEIAPQDPDVLGQGWRCYFDFGVCQLDPRGAVKSKGAS